MLIQQMQIRCVLYPFTCTTIRSTLYGALESNIQTLTCCMNSLTPWMKAGTPDVVTVIEGAPIGPPPAPPATPSREPRSWPRSGGISWDWG